MVKGFQHKKGVDFDEIFAPIVKMTSIRTVLSIAASMDLEVEQLDRNTIRFSSLGHNRVIRLCTEKQKVK